MSMCRKLAMLPLFVFSFIFSTVALADASQSSIPALQVGAPVAIGQSQPLQACPNALHKKLNLAETSQTDCCKGNKGVCGCRAGKIVCCNGTASPNCTCHGDDGFIQ